MRCFRLFVCLLSLLIFISFSGGQPEAKSDAPKATSLNGVWQISAMIDDGEVLTPKLINDQMVRDGRLTISGQKITLIKPGTGEKKELLFINNPNAQPATIDLGGSDKTSGLGIYARRAIRSWFASLDPAMPRGRPTSLQETAAITCS
jgi:hypothetical protein